MRALYENSRSDAERSRWIKMELALVLAEATGRRLGAIRQLQWKDIDLESQTIRWRAESDKQGQEWIVPIPDALADELRAFRRQLGAVGGWVFAAGRKPDQPMDRHLFNTWLTVAEEHAGLTKLEGGLWHPYRRKWATERKHRPIKDVAVAGGWKDTDTLVTWLPATRHGDAPRGHGGATKGAGWNSGVKSCPTSYPTPPRREKTRRAKFFSHRAFQVGTAGFDHEPQATGAGR